MLDNLNNSTWPVVSTFVVALVCVAVAVRESRLRHQPPWSYLWPTFWWTTGALLVVLAVGQASDLGELLADAGRTEALANDWYERRRSAQTVVVGFVALAWASTALIAIWRVPERRRRYLPMALIVFSLICYGTIRVVSLHHIDSLLYHRSIAGAEVGRILEAIGLSLALVASVDKLLRRPRARMTPETNVNPDGPELAPHPSTARHTSS